MRALHHYEDEGLLHPERTASGYRRYGAADVERLQQILLLRSCGLSLGDIRGALDNGDFDFHAVLIDHLATLRARKRNWKPWWERWRRPSRPWKEDAL